MEWSVSDGPVGYEAALTAMAERAAAIARGEAGEQVWLLEHPALYTAGTSARPEELIEARFPVFAAGRGGQFDLSRSRPAHRLHDARSAPSRPDVRRFVATIEEMIIRSLAKFGVRGERRGDRVGVWVRRPERGDGAEDKIAAIGMRIQRWVTLHGFSLNVSPDLSHFSGIVPCGVSDPRFGVTSLADLGVDAKMADVDDALRAEFETLFGATAGAQALASTENSSPGGAAPNPKRRLRADRSPRRAQAKGRRGTARSL